MENNMSNEMEYVQISFYRSQKENGYPAGTTFMTDQMISFDNVERIIESVMIADNEDALGFERIEVTYNPSVEGIKEKLFGPIKKEEV
tara:strand:- start:232 stop:495 length:264 start_codon:yes stop_codon:yes gene_type:complete